MPDSPHMNRREFVTIVTATVGTAIGAAIGLPAVGYIITPAVNVQESDAWIPLGPLESYPVGVPTPMSFVRTQVNGWEKTANSYGVFVIRGEGEEVTVLSNVCTHLSCRVNWDDASKLFVCPCHDAAFDINGEIVHGPQPRPLDEYEHKIEEGNLFIHFVEG
jgi:menaquinol-cytochrome c reductase iron-sulfur subunit